MASSKSEVPVAELGEIYYKTMACILAFESCLPLGPLMEEGWAQNRLADMKLWASSVGALAHPRSSLDRRLEFQLNPRRVLISLLRTLQEFVQICHMLAEAQSSENKVDEKSISKEATAAPMNVALLPTTGSGSDGGRSSPALSATGFSDMETDSGDSTDSDDPEASEEDRLQKMLQKGMKNTEDVLDQLMMLGLAIRKSGTAARLQRADSFFHPDELDAIRELLGHPPWDFSDDYKLALVKEQWRTHFPSVEHGPSIAYLKQVQDLQIFRQHLEFVLYQDSRKQQEQDEGEGSTSTGSIKEARGYQSDLSPEMNHLVVANLRRRNRFAYAKRHQQKLDKAVVPQKVPVVVSLAPLSGTRSDDSLTENNLPQIVSDGGLPTESVRKAIPPPQDSCVPLDISETDPSIRTGDILKPVAVVTEETQSRVSVSTARQNYPSPPPQIEGRKWFRCPCCSQTLPEMFRDKERWRKHLSEDLCPYTCPFPDCSSPAVLYISSTAWREHVLGTHGTSDWECLYCAGTETPSTFASAVELATHIKASHDDPMSEEQIVDIQSSCCRIIPPNIPKCSLCPWPRGLTVEPDAAANLEHVGNCIHEFSLRALPWAEFLEEQTTVAAERSTVAQAKALEWFSTIQEEMDESDIENLSIGGVSIELILIQDVDIKKIDITSFCFLPTLPQPGATDTLYLPEEYFDEHSDESSRAERASSSAGSGLAKVTSDPAPTRPRSPINNTIQSIRILLLELLEHNIESQSFLPADSIYDLTREDLVRRELHREGVVVQEDVVSFASGRGKRTFLTLVYCDRLEYLQPISSFGFDDSELPIGQTNPFASPSRVVRSSYNGSKPDTTLRGFNSIPIGVIKEFIEAQWLLIAPVFSSDQFFYQFHARQPLPFVQRRPMHGRPVHDSLNVRQVRIHPAHFPMLDISVEPMMALSVTNGDSHDQGFAREPLVASLQKIRKLRSDHILSPFTIYERKGYLCTLVPWASGGTLSDFWSRRQDLVDGPQPPAPTVVLWMLEQMCGLAHAISTLHSSISKHKNLPLLPIFVFNDQEPNGLGTLKINCVDKPHSQVRDLDASLTTREDVKYTEKKLLGVSFESTPRLSDMWSIGCIYLEFLVWILSGNGGLREFQRAPNQYEDLRYGHLIFGSAAVDDKISSACNYIGENRGALWDLLCVIRDGLLVVEPSKRVNAETLYKGLMEIHQRARESPGYLYDPNIWIRKRRAAQATLEVPRRQDASQPSRDEMQGPLGPITEDDSLVVTVAAQEDAAGDLVEEKWPRATLSRRSSRDQRQDPLAERIIRKIDWPFEPHPAAPMLCEACQALDLRSLDFHFPFERTSVYLLNHRQKCDFCRVLYCEEFWVNRGVGPTTFRREGPYIRSVPGGDIQCVIYSDPDMILGKTFQTLPGLPMLPEPGGSQQALILEEWLRECDSQHNCFVPRYDKADDLPFTRLLHLETLDSIPIARLSDKSESSLTHCRYAALSYVWGHGGGHRFGTRRANLRQYQERIWNSDFPPTVRDAIRITMSLGIQYLWVDAFCIIQDDPEDWGLAARRMDRVFGSAYCRLAAASASTAYDGMIMPRDSETYLRLPDPKGPSTYISRFIDHFHRDVDRSPLNGRAWVLLERALCCRTIYFTSTQVYMECGEGVRCETLGRIPWENASYLGDSHFPKNALRYFGGSGILLYQHLYAHYTTLDLSVRRDKISAIAPLERRLAQELNTSAAYGILARYLSSSLMWTRKHGTASRNQSSRGQRIPSWSWMAYDGPIEYLSSASEMEVAINITTAFQPFFDQVVAAQTIPDDVEITVPARKLSRPEINPPGLVLDELLDDEAFKVYEDQLLCIPVATEKDEPRDKFSEIENWVIVIAPEQEPGDKILTSAYRRIGAGVVSEGDMAADTVFVTLR